MLIWHYDNWYSQTDFAEMVELKLNTVRIPVGFWFFEGNTIPRSTRYVFLRSNLQNRFGTRRVTLTRQHLKTLPMKCLITGNNSPSPPFASLPTPNASTPNDEAIYTSDLSSSYLRPVHDIMDEAHPLTMIIQKVPRQGISGLVPILRSIIASMYIA